MFRLLPIFKINSAVRHAIRKMGFGGLSPLFIDILMSQWLQKQITGCDSTTFDHQDMPSLPTD